MHTIRWYIAHILDALDDRLGHPFPWLCDFIALYVWPDDPTCECSYCVKFQVELSEMDGDDVSER
jgi:hypothetical protein